MSSNSHPSSSGRFTARLALLLALAALGGCKLFFPAPTPMTSTFEPLRQARKAKCLVLLLPGRGDTAAAFWDEGFVELFQKSGLSVDLIAADATLGYYLRGSVLDRLEADVLGPVLPRGYEQLWVVGISMGGLGALQYPQVFPERIHGVLALAPFLGDEPLGDELRRAGGLKQWTPDPAAPLTEANYLRQTWGWLHRVVTGKQPGPLVYLGFGEVDSFAPQLAVLEAALPKEQVFRFPGGHAWAPWRSALARFLESSELQRRCAP